MIEQGFIPLSSQLGISGTSYRLQLGLINNKWASRMLKGRDVLDSYIFKDVEMGDGDFPNQNYIVGWVLRTVAIPNINPHQIMKTTQALIKQAIAKKTEKKVVASVADTKKVELEKVPQSELKRQVSPGWVKQEGEKSQQEKEEEHRKAFKERVAANQGGASSTIKTKRQLPTIPGASQTEGASVEPAKPAATKSSEESEFCPYCGKDVGFKFCPYCGKPLGKNHSH